MLMHVKAMRTSELCRHASGPVEVAYLGAVGAVTRVLTVPVQRLLVRDRRRRPRVWEGTAAAARIDPSPDVQHEAAEKQRPVTSS